jgi:signal transduction histidine kinase
VRARWVGLQDKLLLANVLLIVATLLFCGAAFATHSSTQIRLLKQEEVRHIAAAAAIAAAPAMAEGDLAQLGELARQMLAAPDLTSVIFYDGRAVPIVAWRESEHGPVQIDASEIPEPFATSEAGQSALPKSDVGVFIPVRYAAQSEEPPDGFISLSVSEAPALAHVQRTVRLITGGGLAILAMVLPLVFLLIQRAFAPIRRLAIAARNVAAGRYETVDIARADALGVLAATFNDMVLRLAEQKKRADEAHARVLDANLHLESKIAERTSAIEAASQRLASEIAEKEDFLRAVSHDLNAPLRNIDGMVTMLLQKHGSGMPQDFTDRLERIKKNVEHETSLINDLLELSHIKTRRDRPEPVNLEELMWELRGLFENDLREREIELIIESRLPTLSAERARIRQVFQNLIDNAIKYMGDRGQRRITIGACIGRSETEFWVRDTGLGIAPDDIDRIFYVFRRGKNQAGVAGKGVGLATVKSILENYNGRIWVESTLGEGSAFRFTINGRFVVTEGPVFDGGSRNLKDKQAAKSETRAA